jgi:hypothetical protein
MQIIFSSRRRLLPAAHCVDIMFPKKGRFVDVAVFFEMCAGVEAELCSGGLALDSISSSAATSWLVVARMRSGGLLSS